MSTKWQRVRIELPENLSADERRALAEIVIEKIRERSSDGIDKNGRSFPGYSQAYKKSLDFKIGGKSGSVNLELSGDMLGSIQLLAHERGSILIGFENGTDENAKADGNIRGTYGNSKPIPGKKRDFLGLPKSEIKKILADFKDVDTQVNNEADGIG